ncbi:phosphoethanolamine transferase [Inhella gelatinilytica]|uniref:Phosphoethanolamine transferase n=1 Tax=Inhella gelatinilytica TaxID=2795030 RepID=A0A931NCR0_9BURK|nr:sulfatase-like hydrolase/transferase [Inhella gelatinilytica]MBH9552287.1 phosphoethanolamine transferase [Inhella gelatinilytica]
MFDRLLSFRRWARPTLSPEALLLVVALAWALLFNRPVLAALRQELEAGWGLQAAVVALLAAIHYLLVAPLLGVRWTQALLALLTVVAACSSHYTHNLGVVLDPAMMRNVLQTEWQEARELIGWGLLRQLLWALPILLVLAWVRVEGPAHASFWRLAWRRMALWGVALGVAVALLLAMFQPLSSLMRNQKGLRYQMLPVAPLYSMPRSVWKGLQEARKPREPIGEDAQAGPAPARPRLLVWVVGETVRAANWGRYLLPEGGERVTAPQTQAQAEWVYFPVMKTCGTDTETSLPCMFAPVGRSDYDEDRIRTQQSLLHVLARAGVQVDWWDAQSGCKGVCEGLPERRIECKKGGCDAQLFAGLPEKIAAVRQAGSGTHLLVLHMLGNHGPSYYRRYGPEHAVFQPECRSDDLGRCSREAIRNAYDNALHATDALLAQALKQLQVAQTDMDVALWFTPDHGESLGEKGLYLHGLPYAFAPAEQTDVPWLMWVGEGWRRSRGWAELCLQTLPSRLRPDHEHLFHTALTLLDVRTRLYQPRWDALAACAP